MSNRFKKEVGRSPTAGEVYIMHQQGYTGSRNLFKNPNAPASSIVGSSAVVQNGGHPGMTSRQLIDKWGSKANGLYSKASGGRGGEMSTADVAYEALSNVAAPREKTLSIFLLTLSHGQKKFRLSLELKTWSKT